MGRGAQRSAIEIARVTRVRRQVVNSNATLWARSLLFHRMAPQCPFLAVTAAHAGPVRLLEGGEGEGVPLFPDVVTLAEAHRTAHRGPASLYPLGDAPAPCGAELAGAALRCPFVASLLRRRQSSSAAAASEEKKEEGGRVGGSHPPLSARLTRVPFASISIKPPGAALPHQARHPALAAGRPRLTPPPQPGGDGASSRPTPPPVPPPPSLPLEAPAILVRRGSLPPLRASHAHPSRSGHRLPDAHGARL